MADIARFRHQAAHHWMSHFSVSINLLASAIAGYRNVDQSIGDKLYKVKYKVKYKAWDVEVVP